MRIKKAVAIHTKYMGPTERLGSRIKATTEDGSASYTMEYMHDTDAYQNHSYAFALLWQKLVMRGVFDKRMLQPDDATVAETERGYTFHVPLE